MTEIDLVEATRGAVFVALEAAHAAGGASVRDTIGQDEPRPFVMLDEIEWENEGGKDDPVLRISIDVVTVYEGQARADLLALMHINFQALHDAALLADGVVLGSPALVGGGATGFAPDGVTYAGTQTFELYAEAA